MHKDKVGKVTRYLRKQAKGYTIVSNNTFQIGCNVTITLTLNFRQQAEKEFKMLRNISTFYTTQVLNLKLKASTIATGPQTTT